MSRLGWLRRLTIVPLGLVGAAAVVAGFAGLFLGGQATVARLQAVGTTADSQRFTFERQAWQAVTVDQLFPLSHSTRNAAPDGTATRSFTRIGVASPASCQSALAPALARLLADYGCGPVLRSDYTDATQTLVATVGVVALHTAPAQQQDLASATAAQHADLQGRALTLAGTAAARFGDQQRLGWYTSAPADMPYLVFVVSGLADGRAASAGPTQEEITQSGVQLVATDLGRMIGDQVHTQVGGLWARYGTGS
jgi:hypothetical protein